MQPAEFVRVTIQRYNGGHFTPAAVRLGQADSLRVLRRLPAAGARQRLYGRQAAQEHPGDGWGSRRQAVSRATTLFYDL